MSIIIQPIKPKFPIINLKDNEKELEVALRGPIKKIVKEGLEATVKNWDNKPQFVGRYSTFQGSVGSMFVFPRNQKGFGTSAPGLAENWRRVSEGVPSHTISAVRAPTLIYRKGYVSKTLPGGVYGRSRGGTYGDQVFRAKMVRHPGFPARNFPEEVVKQIEDEVVSILAGVIKFA